MKKNIIICLLIISMLSTVYFKRTYAQDKNNFVVVLDPGHGGKDAGTMNKDILEKDINLKISLFIKDYLEEKNIKVYMTRNGDYDLSKPDADRRKKSDFDNRIKYINELDANIYLSIHLNYFNDSKYYGPQVFYYDKYDNKKLANIMQQKLNGFRNTDRKAKPIPKNTYMYNKLNIPGLLIECGFLSNIQDRDDLINKDYQKKLANLIASKIIEYFKIDI